MGDPIGDLYVKVVWFEQINSGTSGTLTLPAQAEVVLDQWAAGVDALASTLASGVPDFISPATVGGVIVTATLDGNGVWTLSGTPSAYPVAIIYVYKVKFRYFGYTKQLGGYEFIPSADGVFTDITDFNGILSSADNEVQKALDTLDNHAGKHVNGSDDIQDATATQKGLATATQITKLDGIATEANKYVHPNHSGDVTSTGDGAQVIVSMAGKYIYRADGTDIPIADGGTGQSTAQLAINALSAVGAATNEHVLTKDTATGNAIFKASAGGGGGSFSKSFIITNPTSESDSPVWRTPVAITITAVHVLCVGGTSIVGMLDEYDSNGANPVPVDNSDITGLAGVNVNDDGTLSNPSISAGNYVGWHTTSVNGSVSKCIVTFDYTI